MSWTHSKSLKKNRLQNITLRILTISLFVLTYNTYAFSSGNITSTSSPIRPKLPLINTGKKIILHPIAPLPEKDSGVFVASWDTITGESYFNGINYGKVEQVWLDWNNELRKELWLSLYSIDPRLSTTALTRSKQAKERKSITHKRSKKDWYYNYKGIEKWFANQWVFFKNVNRTTFSESIGYGYYSCKSADCTDALIKAIRSTYDMYLREKNRTSRPHYNALINKNFRVMGLGVVVDEKTKTYYLTVHYGTEVVE